MYPVLGWGELACDRVSGDKTSPSAQTSTSSSPFLLHCSSNPAPKPLAGTRKGEVGGGNYIPINVFQLTASVPSSAHQLSSTSPSITAALNYATLITQQNYITTSCNEGEKLSRVGLLCLAWVFSSFPSYLQTPQKPQSRRVSSSHHGAVSRAAVRGG